MFGAMQAVKLFKLISKIYSPRFYLRGNVRHQRALALHFRLHNLRDFHGPRCNVFLPLKISDLYRSLSLWSVVDTRQSSAV